MTRRRAWSEWLTVWLSFLLVSFVATPLPGVNESHYLTRAKHFWNPDWCSRDFFLTSFPAHLVFYETLGWLTTWLSLPSVAIVGRCLGLGLLAVAWCSLARRIAARGDHEAPAIIAVLSGWLFLGMQAAGNLSGEWLIGGIESKVLAYTCVFRAVSAMLDGRLLLASLLSGMAISFHPIVGLWHVAAVMLVEIADWWLRKETLLTRRWSMRTIIACSALLAVSASAGLLPALQMLIAADAKASFTANYVQVFYRLRHHLDPLDFSVTGWIGYGVASLSLWSAWRRSRQPTVDSERWWLTYVFAAGLFAVAGLLIGLGPRPGELMPGYRWRMALLKFYPFRLFDVLLPLTVSLWLPRWLATSSRRRVLLWGLGLIGLTWAGAKPFVVGPPAAWSVQDRNDWMEACRWIDAHTPGDALFVTPKESDSFKWFAQRAEYVNFKDCPQDAAGVVEWNRRLRLMSGWSDSGFRDGHYSIDELQQLHRLTGAEFFLCRLEVTCDPAAKIYSNGTFQVFQLLPDANP